MIRVGVNKKLFKVFDITNRTIMQVSFQSTKNMLDCYEANFCEDLITNPDYHDDMSEGEMFNLVIDRVEDTELFTILNSFLSSKTIFGLKNINDYSNHFVVSVKEERIIITFVKGKDNNKIVNGSHVIDNKGNKKSSLLFNLLCCKLLSCSEEMRYAQGYFNKIGKKMVESREKIKL